MEREPAAAAPPVSIFDVLTAPSEMSWHHAPPPLEAFLAEKTRRCDRWCSGTGVGEEVWRLRGGGLKTCRASSPGSTGASSP